MPSPHWTEESTDAYKYALTFDFIDQVEAQIELKGITFEQLAVTVNYSPESLKKLFENPWDMTIEFMIKLCKAVGMKLSLLAYDDNDPENYGGPINSQIILNCWEDRGKPKNMFDLGEVDENIV